MRGTLTQNQFTFIRGRNLLDGVVIANEVIHEAKTSKKPCLIFKVDFEKTYDSVSWDFLFYMLNRMGFHEKWVSWIKGCLKSIYISALVNESPTKEFKTSKGLRQGDPMAHFLFLIVAEGLNGLMRMAIQRKLFIPYKVGKDDIQISLLQFANDTLFISEVSLTNVFIIKSILNCFELAVGLKINFSKSKLGGYTVTRADIKHLVALLNCKMLEDSFTYPGIPMGVSLRRSQTWKPIVHKLSCKLASWKQRYLSFRGRICLINSVLNSLPLYFLSFYRIPALIASKIISL